MARERTDANWLEIGCLTAIGISALLAFTNAFVYSCTPEDGEGPGPIPPIEQQGESFEPKQQPLPSLLESPSGNGCPANGLIYQRGEGTVLTQNGRDVPSVCAETAGGALNWVVAP